jgi:hypothetical protein
MLAWLTPMLFCRNFGGCCKWGEYGVRFGDILLVSIGSLNRSIIKSRT